MSFCYSNPSIVGTSRSIAFLANGDNNDDDVIHLTRNQGRISVFGGVTANIQKNIF